MADGRARQKERVDGDDDVVLAEDDVLNYLRAQPDGRVANSDFVAHFRSALKRSRHRDLNRSNIPTFINRLTTISVDADGGKILTLRKEFQLPSKGGDDGGQRAPCGEGGSSRPDAGDDAARTTGTAEQREETKRAAASTKGRNGDISGNTEKRDGVKPEVENNNTIVFKDAEQVVEASADVANEGRPDDDELEKLIRKTAKKSSQADGPENSAQTTSETSAATVRQLAQRIDLKTADGDDVVSPTKKTGHSPSSSKNRAALAVRPLTTTSYAFVADDVDRRWSVSSAHSDYQSMAKLIHQRPSLVRRRDFVTGFTALHWAAKNGRDDVVKLLFGSANPPSVDARSQGGYSPLHVAAMHLRHSVVELLVVVYKARPDDADYSGRRPIDYVAKKIADDPAAASADPGPLQRTIALLKTRRRCPNVQTSGTNPPGAPDQSPLTRRSTLTAMPASASLFAFGFGLGSSSSSPGVLPPRPMPAVVQRRPVSSMRQSVDASDPQSVTESHSDTEANPATDAGKDRRRHDEAPTMRRGGDSTPDLGTLV